MILKLIILMLKQVETYEYENEKTKDKLNELNNKLKIEMNDQNI